MSRKLKKLKKQKQFLQICEILAKNSKAERKKVACIIVRDGRIISSGYNGTIAKNNNTCEINNITLPEVIHAEENAILFGLNGGINFKDCDLYCNISPCFNCAKMIALSGIKRVIYSEEYRDKEPMKWLEKQGVKCIVRTL